MIEKTSGGVAETSSKKGQFEGFGSEQMFYQTLLAAFVFRYKNACHWVERSTEN